MHPFIKPRYDDLCFSRIPATVAQVMGLPTPMGALPASCLPNPGHSYDAVVLLFIDAFGWRFFEEARDRFPFLKRFAQNGVISKLTSQFPSTTAAHVTAIHSGLSPVQSGIYEWNQYEPSLDAVICPLAYTLAGEKGRETLKGRGDPAQIFPANKMYQDWHEAGVKTTLFQSRDVMPSTFNDAMFGGAVGRSYRTMTEGIYNLAHAASIRKSRHYYFYYYSGFDSVAHMFGPAGAQPRAELDVLMHALEHHLMGNLSTAKNTLLMVTADHGMVEVDPRNTLYLNHALPDIARWLATDRAGQPIVAAGSCRDFFLHVKPECLAEAEAVIGERVRGIAEVRRVDDMLREGWFGSGAPSERFLQRVGNLVVLPYAGEAVWWYERGRFEQNYWGMHGGLSAQEMEIPFLAMAV